MELRHLRYFVAVAEELHFRKAAERLFIAQPPLSQQIQNLEREMGVALLHRSNRKVELTPAGAVFLEDARAILAKADAAVERAQLAERGEAGWFGVGFVGSALYGNLPDIIRQFRDRFPDVELVLLEQMAVEQGMALRAGTIHIGFSRLPDREEGFIIEPVVREPLLVAVPSRSPLASRTEVRLTDLAAQPFIFYPRYTQSGYHQFIANLCQQAGFVPRTVQEADEMQTAIGLVAAGIGVAIVPAAIQNLRRDGMTYLPIVDPVPTVELSMTYREGEASPILPHFLDIARAVVAEHPAL